MSDRLRRITDLFVEGETVPFGLDGEGKPVTVWVNKLNSFEVEEARRDGLAARGLRLMELQEEQNAEYQSAKFMVDRWSKDELVDVRAAQMSDDEYLNVLNDIEGEDEWAEKVAMVRRMPQILEDEKAPDDDPRRARLHEMNTEYLMEIQKRMSEAQEKLKRKLARASRAELEEDYYEAWRARISLDAYMETRRQTELFYAMRDCRAVADGTLEGTSVQRWRHDDCSHTTRLVAERSDVKTLPETVIGKVIDALDRITVPERTAGNSAAPGSSSASSESTSASEAVQTGSPQEEMPPVAPTT